MSNPGAPGAPGLAPPSQDQQQGGPPQHPIPQPPAGIQSSQPPFGPYSQNPLNG